MPTETIRPTDAYNPNIWTNKANGYDTSETTYTSKINPSSEPSISFGGGTAETTNSWQAKANDWYKVYCKIVFSKTAAIDDKVSITITDKNGVSKHTVLALTSAAVTKQTYSQLLNMSDWGTSFANIADLRVRVNGYIFGSGQDGATSYVYDVRLEGDYLTLQESIALQDTLKFLAGKSLIENISLTDILNMLITQTNPDETLTISDAIENIFVTLLDESEQLNVGDFLTLLYGKGISEDVTVADALTFLASIVKSEDITLAETLELFTTVAKAENITVADAISNVFGKTFTEGLTVADAIDSYIFIPNNPLKRYGTRMLVDIAFDSGALHYSTEDINLEGA